MTVDLDTLEALAKAALWTGDWNASCGTVDCAYPADSKFAGEFDEIAHPVPVGVSDYIAAAQPKEILSLIAEVRGLRERLEIDPLCEAVDGIDTRDTTIEVLTRTVELLREDAERWATYMRLFSADAGPETAAVLVLAIDDARAKEPK